MAMYTLEQIKYQLGKYPAPRVHPEEYYAQWKAMDDVVNRDHKIRLPEAVDEAEGKSLERLHLRTNYSKVVIQATVTMVLASKLKVYNDEGLVDEGKERMFDMRLIRRLIRYMSHYGGAWILRRPNDKKLPLRVYKPHIAREIPLEEDGEVVKAVLAVEEFQERAADGQEDRTYFLARWYEWVDVDEEGRPIEPDKWRRVIRRTFRSDHGGEWTEQGDPQPYGYMPMQLVMNHDADKLYEASDIVDGVPLFRGLDDLTTKFIKALEDEAWRDSFFANIDEEQIRAMENAGPLNVKFAKNNSEEAEPKVYWNPPADHTQYLEAIKDFMKRIATVTRTSPLELDERPVQDIPAQTLRVLYGPQIARCEETAEYAGAALSELRALIEQEEFTPLSKSRVVLLPTLPISEDKRHQNAKGLLDSDAFSRVQMLIQDGFSREEAEKIFEEAIAEKKRIAQIEAEIEMQIEERRAETQEKLAQVQAETQIKIAKERPAPSGA